MRIDAADLHYFSEDIAKQLLRMRAGGVVGAINAGMVRAAAEGYLLAKLGTVTNDDEAQALHDAIMGKLVDAAESAPEAPAS